MKRLASILLLGILLFNWGGYQLVSAYLQQKADSQLEARLDQQDYDESQLIEFRVPISLPYYNDWKDFERYDGEVEINGIHYKYVKRKIENGELVLFCIPNASKNLLQDARNDFFRMVNDLQHPTQGKKSESGNSLSFKNFTSEYRQETNDWSMAMLPRNSFHYFSSDMIISNSNFSTTPEQPPEA